MIEGQSEYYGMTEQLTEERYCVFPTKPKNVDESLCIFGSFIVKRKQQNNAFIYDRLERQKIVNVVPARAHNNGP